MSFDKLDMSVGLQKSFVGSLTATNKRRDIRNEKGTPVIPSGCPPLDHTTGVGGLPRGRVIEVYGPESSGKCLSPDTFITVEGEGLLTLEEVAQQAEGDRILQGDPDKHFPLWKRVMAAHEATEASHIYFPGPIQTTRVYTEHGHETQGSKTHRLLTLPEAGIARWCKMDDLRPGVQLLGLCGHRQGSDRGILLGALPAFVPSSAVDTVEGAALLGALATVEPRNDSYWIMSSARSQRSVVDQWCKAAFPGVCGSFVKNDKWNGFTGMIRLSDRLSELADAAVHPGTLQSIRQARVELQEAWAAGISLSKGQWTQDDLEVELVDEEAARTFQAVCDNLGVRWTRFSTLSTFGETRIKLSLRSRIDQQTAEEILWQDYQLPMTWKEQFSREDDELHSNAQRTFDLARGILCKAGQPYEDVWIEDLSRDNSLALADRCRAFAVTQQDQRVVQTLDMMAGEHVTFDRVTGIESTGENLCLDLSVPLGHHYIANTHISHNSTLAMHHCNQELSRYPNRVVAYLDYERSTAQAYCKDMGLLEYGDRFALLNPDSLEDSDTMLNDLFKLQVFPSIVVVDSIPAMIPSAFFGRDMSNTPQVGLQARLLGELLSKWVKWAGDYGITFILINQTRTFIDMSGGIESNIRRARIVKGSGEKESEDTPGGNAVKFYSSMRIRLQPKKISYATVFNPMAGVEQQVPVANIVLAFCKKNKCAPPFKSGIFFIEYGKGIDNVRTMLELAKAQKIISGSGGFKLELPSGGKIFSRKELDFIDKLRASEEGQQTLRGLLQWDQAEQLTSQVLSISTVSLEDDDEAPELESGEDLLMAGITVEKIEEQPSLAHQADLIGLVEKLSGGRVGFTGKYDGANQVRSNSLENLNKKLTRQDTLEIQETVTVKKTLIQESIAEDYQEPVVEEAPSPQEEVPDNPALAALQQGATHGNPATPGT